MNPRNYVLAMGTIWLVAGLVEPHISDAGQPMNAVGFVQVIVWAILVYGWVKAHARESAITPPPGASIFAAVLPPLGVPYYAFRAFGAREGAKLTGWALLSLLVFVVLYSMSYEWSARYGA